jgi:hypothetical protein
MEGLPMSTQIILDLYKWTANSYLLHNSTKENKGEKTCPELIVN